MMRVITAGPRSGQGSEGTKRPLRRRGRRWAIGVSALLHALALAAVLLLTRRPPPSNEEMAPSYELMFDSGGSTPSTSPDKGESGPPSKEQTESADQPPTPTPTAPPAEQPPPTPTTPPAEQPPPPVQRTAPPEPLPPGPVTPPEPAPPEAAAPSPPAPSPPIPSPPIPSPPPPEVAAPAPPAPSPPPPDVPTDLSDAQVRLTPPSPPAPAPPAVPDLVLPAPPPPLPPAPRPTPRPRTAPPPGTFANPMDLSFNQAPRAERQQAPRTGAARGSTAARSMDFSLGAPKAGPNRSEAFFDARARNLGADWMQGVKAFWLQHRYYPRQAAENGQDGDVDLELTVDRTGRVQAAIVTSRSGSPWIDMAAVGTFRGAQLPPIPEEITAPYKTTITIHYMLIR